MREANLAHVHSAYDAFRSGDLVALRNKFTEDTVWHTPGLAPFQPTYKGVDSVMSYFIQLAELTDGTILVEPEHMFADDDRVVVLERVSASRGDKHIEFHDVVVYEIRDGKTVETTQYEIDVKALESFWI